jgi:excisionase family DNA binding protein
VSEELKSVNTIAEIAAYLRCSKHSIYQEIHAGRLRVIRVSDRVFRISRKALEDWAEGRSSEPVP